MGAENFVDERFELASLIFRLAGRVEYSYNFTEYQQSLDDRFGKYKAHPAVTFAIENFDIISYDAVFLIAIHLRKNSDNFGLVDNLDHLFNCKRWTKENTQKFLPLLNNFYKDTDFNTFFKENYDYYMEHSEKFFNVILKDFNMEWFAKHGLNPNNLRTIISPTSGNYGGTVQGATPRDNITYSGLYCSSVFDLRHTGILAHEFAHAFSNPIASCIYAENEKFRQWCDDSVDLEKNPSYPFGMGMAYEYITRAYEAMYMVENNKKSLQEVFETEKEAGFPYIEEVFGLIKAGGQNA
ncbi:MAG: DUF4932 domain-containing protein [Defluviitaleaceae bacterium]|nr:DUF4932 domain-containing protein [Defluviitaleaceae bacterium]